MATDLYRNFVFHVVNSIKGGCGKSTFALYLADYWANHDEKVYLIDLDTDGTSWEEDYFNRIQNPSRVYLNDIIDDDLLFKKINVWCKLESTKLYTESNPKFEENVSICIANPKERKKTREYQVDLFEQAVIGLVEDEIISKYKWKNADVGGDYKRVHVIFDMPPGAEPKSESILNRWLLNQSIRQKKDVNLSTDLVSETDKNKEGKLLDGSYEVRLYMMSTLATSSIAANWNYVKTLLKPNSYCDMVDRLFNDKSFSIRFILNDVTNLIKSDQRKTLAPEMLKAVIRDKSSPLYIAKGDAPDVIEMRADYFPYDDHNPGRLQHLKARGLPGKDSVDTWSITKYTDTAPDPSSTLSSSPSAVCASIKFDNATGWDQGTAESTNISKILGYNMGDDT